MHPSLVDSNILIDIFTNDPNWYSWSRDQLTTLHRQTRLYINPVVYSEISVPFKQLHELDHLLARLPLHYDEMPREALFLAGKAFRMYRRNGGNRTSPLPDFFIGAHAAIRNWQVVTRDPSRMRHYYPTLNLITP